MTKRQIEEAMLLMKKQNEKISDGLKDCVNIDFYKDYVREEKDKDNTIHIYSDAINKALSEHETVIIPDSKEIYYIDKPIIMHSNNKITAGQNAVIRQKKDVSVLMIRNENVIDETKLPAPKNSIKDENIFIEGGRWEESHKSRGGYGKSNMYDENRSMYGVSTCMLFSNVRNLNLKNISFYHTAGFSVQCGNDENISFENILFTECFADGLHINGNTKNVYIRNLKGQVGDDIVALNMYDWLDSSINFGPMDTVYCEDVELSADSRYKAVRIEPGVYTFSDNSTVDCSANNMVFKKVRGINTFKLYLQTSSYTLEKPIIVDVGSGSDIYFEDIEINLKEPIDKFECYTDSDKITGSFAAFEIGANIKNIHFENISIKLYKDKFPMSFLCAVGPKSVIDGIYEIFDPYASSTVDSVTLKDITVNNEKVTNRNDIINEITFDKLYDSPYSSGKGKINKIIWEE